MGLLLLNTLRLGMVDHLWTLAVSINVAIVAALPVVVRWLRRRDIAATAFGPSGVSDRHVLGRALCAWSEPECSGDE